jgi:hypothetical protein
MFRFISTIFNFMSLYCLFINKIDLATYAIAAACYYCLLSFIPKEKKESDNGEADGQT